MEYWKKFSEFNEYEKKYENKDNPEFLNIFKIVGFKIGNNQIISKSQQENFREFLKYIKENCESVYDKFMASSGRRKNSDFYNDLPDKDKKEFIDNGDGTYFRCQISGRDYMGSLETLYDIGKKENCDLFTEDKFEFKLKHEYDANIEEDNDFMKEKVANFKNSFKNKDISFNKIYFGAPGTGKSNCIEKIKNTLRKDLSYDSNKHLFFAESNVERVTFHPNYSYSQFVGTYKPVSTNNAINPISYKFVPGPFVKILEKALRSIKNNKKENFLLIIEEINRANVAAVFGDIFQLLDRKDGLSEYAISTPKDLHDYLVESLAIGESNLQELRIPSNMYIWATMNSADQGVFPMDVAFKRRWDFEYLSIDNKQNEVENFVVRQDDSKSDKPPYNWNILRKSINQLLKEKVDWINEDKLLGPWFIKPDGDDEITISSKNFCNKVLMYLYEDVVKIDPSKIFKKKDGKGQIFYSEVAKNWETDGLEIFDGLRNIYESYSPETGDKK